MEILQLRYFYESSNTESFSKTAEKYMVPVTSVSASVKRLEKELGCKLFDRYCNRITLNENGKKLQSSLCNIFSELDKTISELSLPLPDTREIKILVRAMRKDITEFIIDFRKNNPHITFRTVFDFNENNYESYDIIIDEKNDTYHGFDRFKLRDLRIRMKASHDSPLAGKKLTVKQLNRQPFISMGEQSNMHKMLMKVCKNAGFTPDVVALVNDIRCHDRMIESGIGIGLGRETQDSLSVKTVYLDVTDFNERYEVYVYYQKSSAYGNIQNFLDFLKNYNPSFV